jgi:hypothetical protein
LLQNNGVIDSTVKLSKSADAINRRDIRTYAC